MQSDFAEFGPPVCSQTKGTPFAALMADLLIVIFEQSYDPLLAAKPSELRVHPHVFLTPGQRHM